MTTGSSSLPLTSAAINAGDGSLTTQNNESVSYYKHYWYSDSQYLVTDKAETSDYVFLTGSTIDESVSKCYVVNKDITINDRIEAKGTVDLVLMDGCTLTANKGISIPKGSRLKICGQDQGTGKIYSHPSSGPGIGAYTSGTAGGTVEIHGGTFDLQGARDSAGIGGGNGTNMNSVFIYDGLIYARGGYNAAGIGKGGRNTTEQGGIRIRGGHIEATGGVDGAGIGGGYEHGNGTIEITGGYIVAKGGNNAAGIGSGGSGEGKYSKSITITGGEIHASSAYKGAGIGGSHDNYNGPITIGGTAKVYADGNDGSAGIGGGSDSSAGAINITGGEVIAYGHSRGAGIGGGWDGDGGTINISGGNVKAQGGYQAAGIGGGCDKTGNNITISGGTVTATGGADGAAGIGGGYGGDGGNINITGGTVNATAGSVGHNEMGSAGIGGGREGTSGNITISGGEITAQGAGNGSGIGSGWHGNVNSDQTISITGGTVTATGSINNDTDTGVTMGGAGIGTGGQGDFDGTIEIYGDTVNAYVNAYGGPGGPGIGCGVGGDFDSSGRIVIDEDAEVVAVGKSGGAGIGSGDDGYMKGDIVIEGGTVKARSEKGDVNIKYTNLNGSGIGCGGGGSLGERGHGILIKGGTVEATGYGNGAGIGAGGGQFYKNAYIAIKGGDITATGGGGNAPAIGAGSQLQGSTNIDLGADGLELNLKLHQHNSRLVGSTDGNSSVHVSIHDSLRVEVNGSPVLADSRLSTLHGNSSDAVVKTCDHTDMVYTHIDGSEQQTSQHSYYCPHCATIPASAGKTEDCTFNEAGICEKCDYHAKFAVSFDAGIEGAGGTMDTVYWPRGTEYPLPKCGFTAPEDTNVTFAGWRLSTSTYGSDPLKPGATITVDEDIALKAVWEGDGEFTWKELKEKLATESFQMATDISAVEIDEPLEPKEYTELDLRSHILNGSAIAQSINVEQGTFTLKNGDFGYNGTGIHVASGAIAKLCDVWTQDLGTDPDTIADNIAVSVKAAGMLAVGGNVHIASSVKNVLLAEGALIRIDSQLDPLALIKVSTIPAPNPSVVITSGLNGAGDVSNFKSDSEDYLIGINEDGEAVLGKKATISFNGGTGSGSMDSETVASGTHYTLPDCAFGATDHRIFTGWTVGENTTPLQPGEKVTITADTTITANWTWNWDDVQSALDNAAEGDTIKLPNDVTAYSGDGSLKLTSAKKVTLDLNGYTIDRNLIGINGVNDGGAIRVEAGKLTVKDSSASDGNPGTGVIKNALNKANGGGVYVAEDAKFTLEGGTLKCNWSDTKGCGIYSAGELVITGGELNNNTGFGSAVQGGGIYIAGGTAKIAGDIVDAIKIHDNLAGTGGGIYVDAGTLTLGNCRITENNADVKAAGVFVGSEATVAIKGSPYVQNNVLNSGTPKDFNNVYLSPDKVLEIGNKIDGASIGVTLEKNEQQAFTEGLSGKGDDGNFTSDNAAYGVKLTSDKEATLGKFVTIKFDPNGGSGSMGTVKVFQGSTYKLPGNEFTREDRFFICWQIGDDPSALKEPGDVITVDDDTMIKAVWNMYWSDLQALIDESDDGTTIKVPCDITATSSDGPLTLGKEGEGTGKSITIDLNGHTLDRGLSALKSDGSAFVVNAGNTLTIKDSDEQGEAKITGGANLNSAGGGGVYVAKGATLNLVGGTISGNAAVNGGGVYNAGTFNIGDPEDPHYTCIEDNETKAVPGVSSNGGGIYTTGTLKIRCNGLVSGNEAHSNGGGIYIAGGTTTFESGNIKINKAIQSNGGGIYIAGNDSTLNIHGGFIGSNAAGKSGSGIYVEGDGCTVNIKGDITVRDNAGAGGNVYLKANKVLNVTGSLASDAEICMTLENGKGVFTSGLSGFGSKQNFASDSESYIVKENGNGEAMLVEPRHAVTFNPNGGTGAADTEIVDDGTTIELPAGDKFGAPSGKLFAYWSTTADGTGDSYIAGAKATITEDTTFYAIWTSNDTTYTWSALRDIVGNGELSIVPNGGIVGTKITATAIPDLGYQVTSITYKAEKEGSPTVTIWSGVATEATEATFTMPCDHVTVTATFELVTYKVTTDKVVAEVDGQQVQLENSKLTATPANAHAGEPVNLSLDLERGYEFKEWIATPDDIQIDQNGTFRMPASDAKIKAVCEPIVYTATFNVPKTSSGEPAATVNVYYTHDYSKADETNVSEAIARNKTTGKSDGTGSGQINFTVVPAEGQQVDSVSISGTYKNLKDVSDEAGIENTYRVTKIGSDLGITVNMVPTYQITWVDGDGNELKTDEVLNGATPAYKGKTPTKAPTAASSYTFAYEWNTAPDGTGTGISPATAPATYYAQFTEQTRKYAVEFVDEDGTVLKEAKAYDYGTAASEIELPDDPTKPDDAEYTYSFAGWSPAIAKVTTNATYKATYKRTAKLIPIADADVALAGQTYTGKPLEPKPVVTLGGKTLKEGVDYEIAYEDNVNAGTAKVTVKGIGAYTGMKNATFEIAKATSSVKLADQTQAYTGEALAYTGKITRTGSEGELTLAYYSDADCKEVVAASDVKEPGSYYVKATVAADANHEGAVSNVAVLEITGGEPPAPVTATITIDFDGGVLDGKKSMTIVAEVGSVVVMPQAPTRDGYDFDYWKGSKYYPGDEYVVEGDHTFTAVWKEKASPAPKKGSGKNAAATGDGLPLAPMAVACAISGLAIGLLLMRRRCKSRR